MRTPTILSRRVVLAAGAVALTACSTSTSGTGTRLADDPAARSSATFPSAGASASASTSASAAGSASGSAATPGSPGPSSAASSGTAIGGSCRPAADYCDDFSDPSSGWTEVDEAKYYIKYDPTGGGSLRLGSRDDAAVDEQAPTDVTDYAPDHAVRLDADVVLGAGAPSGTFVGLRCWAHKASNGETAGFTFYVDQDSVDIAVRSDRGTDKTIDSKAVAGALPPPGTPVHVAAASVQITRSSGVTADLAVALNGKLVLETTYARTTRTLTWKVGDKVGMLTGDRGSDAFFDNVSVTHITH